MKYGMVLMFAICLIHLTAGKSFACLPAIMRDTETSASIAEGYVIARYGRISGIPVPLIAARITSMFGIGEGVATVAVTRVVKGASPNFITVSQKLGLSSQCLGKMPWYGRVVLLGGKAELGDEFHSFFRPFGFVEGGYEELLAKEKARRNASF